MLRRLVALVCWGTLLLLAPLPTGAQGVCPGRHAEIWTGVAEIAEAYVKTTPKQELSLSGGACDWACGSGRIPPPLIKPFGFLQYNCNRTAAPPSTRLPTGAHPAKTDSQMGLSITDAQYRDETDKIFRSGSTGVGDLMRVPPWLEDASRSGDVKALIAAVGITSGATWMTFSSTSVDNDGEGTGRILIRIRDSQPQPRFEQWIQIAIKGSTNELGRNVDFIAVQLLDDTSKDLTPRVVTFRGYSRTPKGFVLEGPGSSPRRDLSKCYSCHPNGLRAIIPAQLGPIKSDGPMTKPTLADVTKVTTEGTKLAVLGPLGYTASENGPPLGPSTRPGRDQFVANGLKARGPRTAVPGCAAGLTEPRRKAIVAQMDCERCHDGETDRAIVNAGTSIETLNHKVVENTVAPMPPPVTWAKNPSLKLSPSEREVLFKCLTAEYAEILQEWLTSDLLIVP